MTLADSDCAGETCLGIMHTQLITAQFDPHLENLLIEQTRSKHCDAIGVDFCIVPTG